MIHIGLFEGIGGFSLAAHAEGWQTYATCEIEDFPRQTLEYYWPQAYHHSDIKTLTYETIDFQLSSRYGAGWRARPIVLTGGFPCQPYSVSGRRMGKADERHLWPEMYRTIREIQPTWVVAENVHGLTNWNGGMVFEEIHTDLEAAGYQVQSYILPASSIGAPHQRNRVWIVAYRADTRAENLQKRENRICRFEHAANAASERCQNGNHATGRTVEQEINEGLEFQPERPSSFGNATNTHEQRWTKREHDAEPDKSRLDSGLCAESWTAPYPNGLRQPREEYRQAPPSDHRQLRLPDGWEDFPNESPVRSRNDGFSDRLVGLTFPAHRNACIKAYGNAVVPQVVVQIFRAINAYEKLNCID